MQAHSSKAIVMALAHTCVSAWSKTHRAFSSAGSPTQGHHGTRKRALQVCTALQSACAAVQICEGAVAGVCLQAGINSDFAVSNECEVESHCLKALQKVPARKWLKALSVSVAMKSACHLLGSQHCCWLHWVNVSNVDAFKQLSAGSCFVTRLLCDTSHSGCSVCFESTHSS